MQLKDIIDSPCGIRFVIDRLDLQSGFARRWMLDASMMTDRDEIVAAYEVLRRFESWTASTSASFISTLQCKLQGLKDIRTTIKNLSQKATLDDIELFEVKHLAILAADVRQLMKEYGLEQAINIPPTEKIIDILDPDELRIDTFYVYDSYCARLRELRAEMRKNPDNQDALLAEATEIEIGVRIDLSQRLHPFAELIEQAQIALAQVDVNLAKALQMRDMGLCFPTPSSDGVTSYTAMFHPQVKEAEATRGKEFEPVNIAFAIRPTLITGANMGGKTVVLKTLALCQYLYQFGFGIPAQEAQIDVKDGIHFCIGDDQSVERGLSSFAAEMKHIDSLIKASRKGLRLLGLIDEPARTTNPVEGAALVEALLQVLAHKEMSLVMTTHYDVEVTTEQCQRLRVKGFDNGVMHYALMEVHDGEVPHEALNIAQSLDIDAEWIDTAREILNKNAH